MSAYLGVGAYSVSKLALNGLTVSLAREFAPDGIRVNAIAPGLIATEATESGLDQRMKTAVIAGQLVKRVGSPTDVVATVRFLCSSEASFITGQIFASTEAPFFAQRSRRDCLPAAQEHPIPMSRYTSAAMHDRRGGTNDRE